MYRKDYRSAVTDNYSRDDYRDDYQDSKSTLNTQGTEMALTTALISDIARIEAKLDILLNLAYGGGQATNVAASKEIAISPAELSLLRSMTAKQHVTAQLLIEGWSNKDIAHVLNIGENTVKLHVRAVCRKVGTKTRGQAALVLRDIFMNVDPAEYQRSSGGLPVDWATTYNMDVKDVYEKIYRKE